jgi:A/G-specific adenine glycosylase
METSIPLSAEKSQTLHRRLLAWYARAARDLPWRRTGDPYAVWISEIMLQQTQVKTVVPFYERFMERFPDVRSLAESKLDEVLRVWAGLGYYSRARNLHAAARRIVQIAFGEDTPVLDGNVMRVLTRLFAITLDPRSTPGQKALWDLAGRLLPPGKGSTWNQALMELGALVCLPENASCLLCPVSSACEAYRRGEVERYPVRAERRKVPVVQGLCSIVRRGGQYLFVQRPEKGLLGGLWEFPTAELSGLKPRPGMVEDFVRETLGLEGTIQSKLGVIRHVFTHRDLRLHLFTFDVTGGRLRAGRYRAHRWVRAAEVKRFPISALTKKVLARLSEERAS